jgi:outer membrane protein OmpA-like peptidoglycan-associated protein
MTATTPEATTVQGAPRRLVEDAWKAMNRRYALGTLALFAALLLLWISGNGPGAWRAGGTGTSQPAAPAAPAASAGAAKAPPVAVPSNPPANGGLAGAPAGPGASGSAAAAPGGSAAAAPAPAAGAAAPQNGADPGLPKALPGAPVARLYFGPDQAWPASRVGPALAPVLARLKAEPDTKALVSGFHDRRGSPERNAELALRRAQAVRRVLIREGVAADRIVLAKPQQSQGSGSDREARRVEVTVAR